MIKNDLQYRVTKSALKKFQETLERHEELTRDQEPRVRDLHKATIEGEVAELKRQIKAYEQLKAGAGERPKLEVVSDIPKMLIQARIALGWTQQDLAKRLGVTPQQVQADEANDYSTASFARITKVALILRKARPKMATKPTRASRSAGKRKTVKRVSH